MENHEEYTATLNGNETEREREEGVMSD